MKCNKEHAPMGAQCRGPPATACTRGLVAVETIEL